ncbi:MAG: CehA/McbA family metallohydrolase, partial [bacterium]|nr:CehA/McbA family metallohydrolase [bacterium]
LLQSRWLDLDEGSSLTVVQEIWVGERSDAASVTDLLQPQAPLLTGRCDDPACSVHVDRPDGRPFTERRADRDGRFSVRLPAGRWNLRVRSTAGREVQREVELEATGRDLGTIEVGAVPRVRLPRNGPMRLVFLGEGDTPDPNWADDLRGYRLGDNDGQFRSFRPLRDLHLTGTAWDPVAISIPPGRYRVIATRGPEFELSHASFEATVGSEIALSLDPPRRAFDTPRWISADLHVHGAASFDTPTLNDRRVASYVAEGAEVLVSSDHENVHDYGPDVVRMGLTDRVATVVGLEVTGEVKTASFPNSTGHANVIPMPRDPLAYRRGTVANENRRWRDILRELRALPGTRLVQLNHARGHRGEVHWRSFLTHMGSANTPYDPARPLTAEGNRILIDPDPQSGLRDIDFDAMEILNGPYPESGRLLVRDWLSFLAQGERLTATANSDSHTLESVVGAPRNYVRMGDDRVAAFDEGEFIAALRDGHACGSTGPWLSVEVSGAGPGQLVAGSTPTLTAHVVSASWVPVDRMRIWRNTALWKELEIPADGKVALRLDFEADGLVFVEVFGEASGDYLEVLPGHSPYAFCNPIRVDADSDGTWQAPGLPSGG